MCVLLQSLVHRPAAISYHPRSPWLAVCGEGQVGLWSDDGVLLANHDRPGVSQVSFGPEGTLAWATECQAHGGDPFATDPAWELDAGEAVTQAGDPTPDLIADFLS